MVIPGRPVAGTTRSGNFQAAGKRKRTKNTFPGGRIINHLSACLSGKCLGQIQITVILSGGHLINPWLEFPRESDKTFNDFFQHHRGNSQMTCRGDPATGAKGRRPPRESGHQGFPDFGHADDCIATDIQTRLHRSFLLSVSATRRERSRRGSIGPGKNHAGGKKNHVCSCSFQSTDEFEVAVDIGAASALRVLRCLCHSAMPSAKKCGLHFRRELRR